MVFDIDVASDRDVRIDDGNDLATVDDRDRLSQHVFLNVGQDIRRLVGSNLTGTQIVEIEQLIAESLRDAEDVEAVLSVDLLEYNRDTNTIIAEFTTEATTESLEVPL